MCRALLDLRAAPKLKARPPMPCVFHMAFPVPMISGILFKKSPEPMSLVAGQQELYHTSAKPQESVGRQGDQMLKYSVVAGVMVACVCFFVGTSPTATRQLSAALLPSTTLQAQRTMVPPYARGGAFVKLGAQHLSASSVEVGSVSEKVSAIEWEGNVNDHQVCHFPLTGCVLVLVRVSLGALPKEARRHTFSKHHSHWSTRERRNWARVHWCVAA